MEAPPGSSSHRLTAVQRAQQEALRSFGGLSLGNVLGEPPKPVERTLLERGPHVPTPRERKVAETEAAFGASDLADLNVRKRDALCDVSDKRNSVVCCCIPPQDC